MRLLLAAARSPSGPGKTTYIDCINRDRSYWIVPRVETRGNMSIASAEMQERLLEMLRNANSLANLPCWTCVARGVFRTRMIGALLEGASSEVKGSL